MDQMSEALTNRLGKSIPLVGSAFKAADFDRSSMGKVVGLIYDAVSSIAGSILDALGVESLLESLADQICDLLDDPNIPVTPETWSASCGGADGGSWTCTEECSGAVTVTAEDEVCGDHKSGSAGLECIGCNEDNCTGCCDGGSCLEFGAQSADKCGTGGAACEPCPEYHDCEEGACKCTSDCTTPGETECVGNDVWICTQVVDDPPCNKLQLSAPCINGAECEGGECVGGCHAENCDGCCLSDGTCMPGDSTDYCGKEGETCQYCAGGYDECVDGECVCQPQCEDKECGPDGCEGTCGTCPAGSVCDDDGMCQNNCGNGTIDDGEECENDSDCTGQNESCQSCQCELPSQEVDCMPPSQNWEGDFVKQVNIKVETDPCGCTPGPGYSEGSAVTLDNIDGEYAGSLDPPWNGVSSDPPGLIKDMGGWYSLEGLEVDTEIVLILENVETGAQIAIHFTLTPGYVWNLTIECLGNPGG